MNSDVGMHNTVNRNEYRNIVIKAVIQLNKKTPGMWPMFGLQLVICNYTHTP